MILLFNFFFFLNYKGIFFFFFTYHFSHTHWIWIRRFDPQIPWWKQMSPSNWCPLDVVRNTAAKRLWVRAISKWLTHTPLSAAWKQRMTSQSPPVLVTIWPLSDRATLRFFIYFFFFWQEKVLVQLKD